MKVFEFNYDNGSYAGGVAIVVANDIEKAHNLLGKDYHWIFDHEIFDLSYTGIEAKIITIFTYIE